MKKALLLLTLIGCGSEREVEPKQVQGGPVSGAPIPGGEVLSFNDVKPIIATYCAPCHSSSAFTKSSTGWFASEAPNRVKSLNMPPPASTQGKTLSAIDRQKLLNFK